MILGFKKTFPDGTPTDFKQKIIAGVADLGFIQEPIKIHSIRAGQRWRAGMSIEMAYGVRTKQYHQFNKGLTLLETCKSVQSIEMDYDLLNERVNLFIDGRKMDRPKTLNLLIKNDGLTHKQFMSWFFSDGNTFSGQIIHWTNFKY